VKFVMSKTSDQKNKYEQEFSSFEELIAWAKQQYARVDGQVEIILKVPVPREGVPFIEVQPELEIHDDCRDLGW